MEIPDSAALNEASDRGQWKDEVRSHTKNRTHWNYEPI